MIQGACGCSYAFSSVVPLEVAPARKGQRVVLSEKELVDCSEPNGNNGCNGGWPTNAYNYVKKFGGLNQDSQYPYKATVQTCNAKSSRLPIFFERNKVESGE